PEQVSNETRTKPPQNTSPEASQQNSLQQCHIELVEMPAKTSFNSPKPHLQTHLPTHRETSVMLNEVKHLLRLRPCLQRLLKTYRQHLLKFHRERISPRSFL